MEIKIRLLYWWTYLSLIELVFLLNQTVHKDKSNESINTGKINNKQIKGKKGDSKKEEKEAERRFIRT